CFMDGNKHRRECKIEIVHFRDEEARLTGNGQTPVVCAFEPAAGCVEVREAGKETCGSFSGCVRSLYWPERQRPQMRCLQRIMPCAHLTSPFESRPMRGSKPGMPPIQPTRSWRPCRFR